MGGAGLIVTGGRWRSGAWHRIAMRRMAGLCSLNVAQKNEVGVLIVNSLTMAVMRGGLRGSATRGGARHCGAKRRVAMRGSAWQGVALTYQM